MGVAFDASTVHCRAPRKRGFSRVRAAKSRGRAPKGAAISALAEGSG